MSRKRSKWKFSPARKRRPVEAASSEIPEIVIEEEVGAESLEIAAAEDKVEERSTEIAVAEEKVGKEAAENTSIGEKLETELADNVPVEPEVEAEPAEDLPEEPEVEAEPAEGLQEEAEVEVELAEDLPEETEVEDEPTEDLLEESEVEDEPTEDSAIEDTEKTEAFAEGELPLAGETDIAETPAAVEELPDYYFDEEDVLPELKRTALPEQQTKTETETEAEPETGFEAAAEMGFGAAAGTGKLEIPSFVDEDDILEEELNEKPQLSIYERGGSGKKKKGSGKGKKDKKRSAAKKTVKVGDLILGDGSPKICVPITGRGKDQIVEQAQAIAQAAPDLAEWRVDYLEEAGGKKDIIDILVAIRNALGDIPLLFTYRTESEGGYGRVGWSHYAELLEWAACRPEIDLIDVEAMGLDVDTEGLIHIIHGRGTPVIASVHYCGEMPGKKERKEALRFLRQSGGDIIKMAFTPQNEEDVLDLMSWTYKKSKKMEQPLVTMAMGDAGRVSRVSGRLTGSAMTFGCLDEASAPGQIPVSELRRILDQI